MSVVGLFFNQQMNTLHKTNGLEHFTYNSLMNERDIYYHSDG